MKVSSQLSISLRDEANSRVAFKLSTFWHLVKESMPSSVNRNCANRSLYSQEAKTKHCKNL